MAIRKRKWTTAKGERKEAWIVDYFDQGGTRRLKTFTTKKKADAWARTALYEVDQGIHTPDRESVTVKQAVDIWLDTVERVGRNGREPVEPATLRAYKTHKAHIEALIGDRRLNQLTPTAVTTFRDELLKAHSRALARKVLTSFKSAIKEAMSRGLVARNVADGVSIVQTDRYKAEVQIPARAEMKAILGKADELAAQKNKQRAKRWRRFRALIYTATMTGMRASELRGLTWANLDLKRKVIEVRQRADEKGIIGPLKTAAGRRDIAIPDALVKLLKAWKLECPHGDLVFPTWQGGIESLSNIYSRCWSPLLVRAGVAEDTGKKDEEGEAIMAPRYNFHALRHFHASRLIATDANPKEVQTELGHASIKITYDLYGHMFKEDMSGRHDRAKRLAAELA